MTDYNELDYLGMTDGIYYFRDKGSQGGPAYKGDESDYLNWVWAQSTGVKTVKECAACPVVAMCDAHITGGSWHHRQGAHPCKPTTDIMVAS